MRGFFSMELLISFGIFSMVLSSLAVLSFQLPEIIENGIRTQAALTVANDQLATALTNGALDFASVVSVSTTTENSIQYSLTVTEESNGYIKDLRSTVSWEDANGTTRYDSLTAVLTDISDQPMVSWCTISDTDSWQSPTLSSIPISQLSQNATQFALSSLAVGSSTLILLASSTAAKGDPDMLVFDISSTTNPIFDTSFSSQTTTTHGIAQAVYVGSLVYAASAVHADYATCSARASCSQLQIISLANPFVPTVISNYQLATTSAPFANGTGGQSSGRSVAYANGYLYLGLDKNPTASGDEFNILDVHNPTAPQWEGGYSIGRSVTSIAIQGVTAYVTTDDPSKELLILDVSDPTSIKLLSSYAAPGNPLYGYGRAVGVASSTILLGRSYAYQSSELLFVTDSQNQITLLGTAFAASSSAPVSISTILTQGTTGFVLADSSLSFWDTTSPDSPTQKFAPFTFSTTTQETSLSCRKNTLYVGSIDGNKNLYLNILSGTQP